MDATTTLTLRCTVCGVLQEAKCSCGASYGYISPGELAAKAVMDNPGMSDRSIADKIGVDKDTVNRARKSTGGNPPVDAEKRTGKDGKTRRLPKKRKNNPKQEAIAANQVLDGAKTQKQAAQDVGLDSVQGVKTGLAYEQGRRDAFAEIGADADFSKITAQQKRDAALRMYKKELDRQFEKRVAAEYTARVQKQFPELEKMERDARDEKRLYERLRREIKTPMTMAEYTLVCSLLHPDSRESVSRERLMRAFQMFEPKVFALTGEKKKNA